MPILVAGSNMEHLQAHIEEHFNVGDKVELILGMPAPLTAEEVSAFQSELAAQGLPLTAPVQFGSTDDWKNAVRVEFRRPSFKGVGALPLAVLLVLAAGAVGVVGILGWKAGNVIDQISNYIVPLALIGGGVLIFMKLVESRSPS